MNEKIDLVKDVLSDLCDAECLAIYEHRKNFHSMDIGNIIIKALDLYKDEIKEIEGDDDGADDEVDRRLQDELDRTGT